MELNPGPERIAPSIEDNEKITEKLDLVVVIPCYEEGFGVIKTIKSVVEQRDANDNVLRGIVVVINNPPSTETSVYWSNMKTYALLQGLRSGKKITIDGDSEMSAAIKLIQDSNITIEVIDAFSDGFAMEQGNVGKARRIGTAHALGLLSSDSSLILSTDADSWYGDSTLGTVSQIFNAHEEVNAMPLQITSSLSGLEGEAREAALMHFATERITYAYHHVDGAIRKVVATGHALLPDYNPKKERFDQRMITMGGGYSAFRLKAYKAAGGYKDIPGGEDVLLGFDISRSVGGVAQVKEGHQLKVYTQARVSDRTKGGYGSTIGEWQGNTDYAHAAMAHPEWIGAAERFFIEFENVFKLKTLYRSLSLPIQILFLRHGFDRSQSVALMKLYAKLDGFNNTLEQFEFVKQAREFLKANACQSTVGEVLNDLQEKNKEYSAYAFSLLWGKNVPDVFNDILTLPEIVDWRYENISSAMDQILEMIEVEPTENELVLLQASSSSVYIHHAEKVTDALVRFIFREILVRRNQVETKEFEKLQKNDLGFVGQVAATCKADHMYTLASFAADILKHRGDEKLERRIQEITDLFHDQYHEAVNAVWEVTNE